MPSSNNISRLIALQLIEFTRFIGCVVVNILKAAESGLCDVAS